MYTVKIYRLNTTCFDHQHLNHSEIVFQPYFEFTQPPFPYEVIVTPRSNVEGAMNGTSATYSSNHIAYDNNCSNKYAPTLFHVVTDYATLDIEAAIVMLNDSDIYGSDHNVDVALHLIGKVIHIIHMHINV